MIRRSAFTLIELLVVVSIITILVLIALPRFQAMMYAQQETLSENVLRVAIRGARDAALRSSGEDDTAAVFVFEPRAESDGGGRTSIIVCKRVGTYDLQISGDYVTREVFAPMEGVTPVQLPRGFNARGYAPPGTLRDGWYDDPGRDYQANEGNWVFPETNLYDEGRGNQGEARQTFMVRFRAGSGAMVTSPLTPVFVVLMRPSYADNGSPRNAASNDFYVSYDRVAATVAVLRGDPQVRAAILGPQSSDVVLTRPLSQVSIYDERKLATDMGVQVDRLTGCVYKNSADAPNGPEFVNSLDAARVNQWIQGDTDGRNGVEPAGGMDRPVARVFSFDRYTGVPRLVEVQP